jgi:uncharacterized protein (TIGR03437 family)
MDPSCEGTVTFLDGSAWAGTALPEQGGRFRLTHSRLTVGLHRMVAVYSGGAICPNSTSDVLEQVVLPVRTATIISVAKVPSGANDAFVLAATIQVLPPGSGTPVGEVAFHDGDTLLGSSNLSPGGVAILPVNLDPAAPHGVGARYMGNSEFAASASVRLTDLSDLTKPDFEAAYVVNSASFAPGLSPGAFATIFGSRLSGGTTAVSSLPYPTTVQGVQVVMDGRAARLAYVSDRQLNFLVPADAVEGTASLVVSTPLGSSKTIEVPLVAASPGIFADPLSGYGAILIAGTAETTLTRPVQAGEYVEIYGTGLGAVDASSRTILPVTVNIGSLQLPAAYSGLNPVYPGL